MELKMDEINKLAAVNDEQLIIMDFMEFAASKGIYLSLEDNTTIPVNVQNLFYEFHNINKNELEKERKALLDSLN